MCAWDNLLSPLEIIKSETKRHINKQKQTKKVKRFSTHESKGRQVNWIISTKFWGHFQNEPRNWLQPLDYFQNESRWKKCTKISKFRTVPVHTCGWLSICLLKAVWALNARWNHFNLHTSVRISYLHGVKHFGKKMFCLKWFLCGATVRTWAQARE